QPGELRVVAYKAGKKLGEKTVRTAGKPARLKLTVDRAQIEAGGMDLAYILVEALDENGNPAPLAGDKVSVSVEGNGSIAGVGNGNPQSFEPFQAEQVSLFNGKAMIIVRSGSGPGEVVVTAQAEGLGESRVEVAVQ
ncbi:MAG: glycoside hydrolase family 2, partial [Phaeodactylibacter sp.]|nr:glycoside hydrolase family 2 [Phaeodactylibacter sp.]